MPKPAQKYFTVKVPCKPYIKKYGQFLCGGRVWGEQLAIRADQYSSLGFVVKMCLEKKVYENRNISNSAAHKGMEDFLLIQINRWQFENIGFDLSPESVLLINKFLEQQFQEHLYTYCQAHTKNHERYQGYKEAIEDFAELVGIELEYDISYDGLKKMEYRFRQKREECKREAGKLLLFQ